LASIGLAAKLVVAKGTVALMAAAKVKKEPDLQRREVDSFRRLFRARETEFG
jgi:hypothetical protein